LVGPLQLDTPSFSVTPPGVQEPAKPKRRGSRRSRVSTSFPGSHSGSIAGSIASVDRGGGLLGAGGGVSAVTGRRLSARALRKSICNAGARRLSQRSANQTITDGGALSPASQDAQSPGCENPESPVALSPRSKRLKRPSFSQQPVVADSDSDDDGYQGRGEGKGGFLHYCLRSFYAPFVTHRIGRVAIILVFLGWLIYCCVNIPKIEQGLCDTCVLPADSYLVDYNDVNERVYGEGEGTVYIVFDDPRVQWDRPETLEAVERLRLDLERLPAVLVVNHWLHNFMAWTSTNINVASQAGSEEWEMLQDVWGNFYWLLDRYLAEFPEATRQVIRDPVSGKVIKARSIARQRLRDETFDKIDDMESIRETFRQWSEQTGVQGYVAANSWPFSDGDNAIEGMIYSTLYLSAVAVFIALLAFVSPFIAALITLTVITIDVSILGWMYMVDVPMSPVSYIVIAMSVGMAVDYCAHVGIAFATCMVNSRSQSLVGGGGIIEFQMMTADYYARVAMEEIGGSVFAGGTSTLLGVVALSGASSSTFFTFFLMLFGTVMFGMLHGFVLFPAILASLPQWLVEQTVIRPVT